MKVPLLDLKVQLAPIRDEIIQEITRVVDSSMYILGPDVKKFEENIATYCGSLAGIGVASGTDALLCSFMGLGLCPGDKVITTSYSFFATMGSMLRLGVEPLFADIDPVSFNIDPVKIREILENGSANIKAIVPVHLYGQCADMTEIMAIAHEYHIPVIEDAAQAIGACFPVKTEDGIEWRRAGSFGDAGCFSFFPSKNLGGMGDGGMITVQHKDFAEKLNILRVHGGKPKYYHNLLGGNFRIDAMQAAILDVKLNYLPEWHRGRRQNALIYEKLFTDTSLVDRGIITLPSAVYRSLTEDPVRGPDYHIYNQFIVRVRDRDELREYLLQKDIGVEVYYPVPLHQQGCYVKRFLNAWSLAETDKAALETLALPIYAELTSEMLGYVVEQIVKFYKMKGRL